MFKPKRIIIPLYMLIAAHCMLDIMAAEAPQPATIKLYTLDGGTLDLDDMAALSNDGAFAGRSIRLAIPAFLIRHPKGDLLWDTGMPDAVADTADGLKGEGYHYQVKHKLVDQLKMLHLAPADIDFLAVSHGHPDHIGNAALFTEATFIVGEKEHADLFSPDKRADKQGFDLYGALEQNETVMVKDRHDIFGDGSAVVYATPGHSEGHLVLLLKLPNAGAILFSGDLYIHVEGRKQSTIPSFSANKEALRQSMARFEALAKKENARVIIQHDMTHFEALPQIPTYLD